MERPDWKPPEQKLAHRLVETEAEGDDSAEWESQSNHLQAKANSEPDSFLAQNFNSSDSSGAVRKRPDVPGFLLHHERNLYWLLACAFFIGLANWFLNTHGYFEFSSSSLQNFFYAIAALSPAVGVAILSHEKWRTAFPFFAISAFLSLIFLSKFIVCVSCVLLLFCWTKRTRFVGFVLLLLLQVIFLDCLFKYFLNQGRVLEDKFDTGKHSLVLYNQRRVNFLRPVDIVLEEHLPVTTLFQFVKVHYRFDCTMFTDSLHILPIDQEHVYVLIKDSSHYSRTFVDLSGSNKPIPRETEP